MIGELAFVYELRFSEYAMESLHPVEIVRGETTEQTLARRRRKRQSGIECVKRSAEYVHFKQHGAAARCVTPDHTDLSISKREWEHSMQTWRHVIKQTLAWAAASEYVGLGATRVTL
jgi:hypothetical protein